MVCSKFKGELKYHTLHADVWMKSLAEGNEESKMRMQNALNLAYPMALSIFEPSKYEQELIETNIFEGEVALEKVWTERVTEIIKSVGLTVPAINDKTAHYGGRYGVHTPYLQPLLNEMTEVFQIDPSADW